MAKYYMEEVFSLKDGGYDFAPFEYEDDPFEYEDDEGLHSSERLRMRTRQETRSCCSIRHKRKGRRVLLRA